MPLILKRKAPVPDELVEKNDKRVVLKPKASVEPAPAADNSADTYPGLPKTLPPELRKLGNKISLGHPISRIGSNLSAIKTGGMISSLLRDFLYKERLAHGTPAQWESGQGLALSEAGRIAHEDWKGYNTPPEEHGPAIKALAAKFSTRPLDSMCQDVLTQHPNAIVSWWMMASYLYERHGISLLSDAYYDQLAKDLAARYDSIHHAHKHLIPKDFTKSGFGIDYPITAKYAACRLVEVELGFYVDDRHQ